MTSLVLNLIENRKLYLSGVILCILTWESVEPVYAQTEFRTRKKEFYTSTEAEVKGYLDTCQTLDPIEGIWLFSERVYDADGKLTQNLRDVTRTAIVRDRSNPNRLFMEIVMHHLFFKKYRIVSHIDKVPNTKEYPTRTKFVVGWQNITYRYDRENDLLYTSYTYMENTYRIYAKRLYPRPGSIKTYPEESAPNQREPVSRAVTKSNAPETPPTQSDRPEPAQFESYYRIVEVVSFEMIEGQPDWQANSIDVLVQGKIQLSKGRFKFHSTSPHIASNLVPVRGTFVQDGNIISYSGITNLPTGTSVNLVGKVWKENGKTFSEIQWSSIAAYRARVNDIDFDRTVRKVFRAHVLLR